LYGVGGPVTWGRERLERFCKGERSEL